MSWHWGVEDSWHAASSCRVGKMRLSYWHAGTGSRTCPETAVKQQSIQLQSGTGTFSGECWCAAICVCLLSLAKSPVGHCSNLTASAPPQSLSTWQTQDARDRGMKQTEHYTKLWPLERSICWPTTTFAVNVKTSDFQLTNLVWMHID